MVKAEKTEPPSPMSLRKRAGLTQRQVAEALNKKVQTISDWERGVAYPNLTFLEIRRLMELYHCTIDELVEAFDRRDSVCVSQ